MNTFATWGAVALLVVGLSGGAQAAPDRTARVDDGQMFEWTGTRATAVSNHNYWGLAPAGPLPTGVCSKNATTYCEQVLLELHNPLTPEQVAAGVKRQSSWATVWIDGFGADSPLGTAPGAPVNDLDLLVYESDANGTRGSLIASDGDLQNTNMELVSFGITTTPSAPSRWVLVHIVYFQVVDSGYKGHITF